jgi:hypothetical protein
MTHLTDKIAEFVFGELSAAEMAEGQRHLTQCSDCRQQVENFQGTYAMLKTSPDAEPPRRILFEFEKPQASGWIWRWLAPMATSAAVAVSIVSFWPKPQPQIIERVVQQQVTAPAPVASQPVDYQQTINELRAELQKRDAEQSKQFQRVRDEMMAFHRTQQALEKDTDWNSSEIQRYAANFRRN